MKFSQHICITARLYARVSLVCRYMAQVVQHMVCAIHQAPVVQEVDITIHRINHYPLDSANDFLITYPLDSDVSGG